MLYTTSLLPITYKPPPRAYGHKVINGVLAHVVLTMGSVDSQTT